MAYRNPVLIEIYARLMMEAGCFPSGKLTDVLPQLKAIGLSDLELGQGLNLFPIQPELVAGPDTISPRIRCWDPEKLRLVQLAQDMVIVNQTKKYLGWSSFMELVANAQKALRTAGIAPRYKSIALGTIDQFLVPREGYALGKWLNCDGEFIPRFYKDSIQACDIVLGLGFLDADRMNTQLNVRVRPKKDQVEIRFESTFDRVLEPSDSLDSMLERHHQDSYKRFEALITDRVRNDIMQGKA